MPTDRRRPGGYTYLIHLDAPLVAETGKGQKTARHYIGAAGSLHDRIRAHEVGTGSRFLREARRRGITFRVVRHWRFTARRDAFTYEAALKARKRAEDFCPVCRAERGLPTVSLCSSPRRVLVAPRGIIKGVVVTPSGDLSAGSYCPIPVPVGKRGHRGQITRRTTSSQPS